VEREDAPETRISGGLTVKGMLLSVHAHGRCRAALLVCLATCVITAHANAATISIVSTDAHALSKDGALVAMDTLNLSDTTLEAVADVAAGHLGGLASTTNAAGTAIFGTWIIMTFNFFDTTPDDFLTMDMSLNGTYALGGAFAAFSILDPTPVQTSGIGCGHFNDVHYGVPCRAQSFPQPVFFGNAIEVVIPIDGVDSMTLQWTLDAGTGGIGTTNFLNSADFSISVPDGTVITNDPGGRLFHPHAAVTPVPEPATLLLLASGCVMTARRLRSGKGPK
jgi:hypothetical protein